MLTISLVAAMANLLVVFIMLTASSSPDTTAALVAILTSGLSTSMTLLTLGLLWAWWQGVSKNIRMIGQDSQTTSGGPE